MRNARRFIALLASVAVLSTGAAVLTSRAADQTQPPVASHDGPDRPVAGTPASSAGHHSSLAPPSAPATNTAASPSKPAGAKSPAQGAPQVPEESATVRDDPTIAPDPKQSADNSVSFPNDI